MCNNEYSDQRGAGTAEVSNYKLILQNAKRSERRMRLWNWQMQIELLRIRVWISLT